VTLAILLERLSPNISQAALATSQPAGDAMVLGVGEVATTSV